MEADNLNTMVMDVMSCYIGDQNDLRRFVKSYAVNGDFRPFIEFTTAN